MINGKPDYVYTQYGETVDPLAVIQEKYREIRELKELMYRAEQGAEHTAVGGNSVSATETQIGGTHYSKLKIQPIEYIHANNIPFAEGSIIKYVTRWRDKGGVKDLEKAKHFIELLIELEAKNAKGV